MMNRSFIMIVLCLLFTTDSTNAQAQEHGQQQQRAQHQSDQQGEDGENRREPLRIHRYFVVDPRAKELNPRGDANRMANVIQAAEELINGETYSTTFITRKRDLITAITQSAVGENDVVVFYYSGHGQRNGAPIGEYGQLPLVRLLDEKMQATFFEVGSLLLQLQARRPRLLLAVIDACNFHVGKPQPLSEALVVSVAAMGSETLELDEEMLADNVVRLFSSARGSYVVSSSSPGEVAITVEERTTDGSALAGVKSALFTWSLEQAIKAASTGQSVATWDSIFAQASNEASRLRTLYIGSPQTPPLKTPEEIKVLQATQTMLLIKSPDNN